MKTLKSPQVGDKAVVSKAVDTQVYVVKEIVGQTAVLEYFDGKRMVLGGSFPAMHLARPTKAQLARA